PRGARRLGDPRRRRHDQRERRARRRSARGRARGEGRAGAGSRAARGARLMAKRKKAPVGIDDWLRTGGKVEDLPQLEKKRLPPSLAGRGVLHPWLHLDEKGVVLGRI